MSLKKRANTCMVSSLLTGARHPSRRTLRGAILAGGLLVSGGFGWAQAKPAGEPPTEQPVDPRILQVKRLCIQKFGEDALGVQVQEMVIAKLFESKRFSLTESCERAQFALKGSITERSKQTFGSESEGVSFGQGAAHENLSSSQTKEHAVVTLRLVDKEGDIVWAISVESAGGKTKGAIGDAAERAVRRLLRDIERAERQAQKTEKSKQP